MHELPGTLRRTEPRSRPVTRVQAETECRPEAGSRPETRVQARAEPAPGPRLWPEPRTARAGRLLFVVFVVCLSPPAGRCSWRCPAEATSRRIILVIRSTGRLVRPNSPAFTLNPAVRAHKPFFIS